MKIKIRLAVLTADYLTSDNEPNPSARCGKQACLTLVCSYHAIGNVVFDGYCHAPTRPLWSFWLINVFFVDHAKFQNKHALFLVLSGRGAAWSDLPAPQLMFLAENRHSDPTADGAASPVPRWPNRLAGIINGPWAIPMAPSRRQSPVHVRRWVLRQFYSQHAQKT